MAQRMTGVLFPRPSLWSTPLRMAPLREPEEQQAIPAGTGDLTCDGAQRPISARLELKPPVKHFHNDLAIIETACEQCAGRRQSLVPQRLSAIHHRRHIDGNLTGQKHLWRPNA